MLKIIEILSYTYAELERIFLSLIVKLFFRRRTGDGSGLGRMSFRGNLGEELGSGREDPELVGLKQGVVLP